MYEPIDAQIGRRIATILGQGFSAGNLEQFDIAIAASYVHDRHPGALFHPSYYLKSQHFVIPRCRFFRIWNADPDVMVGYLETYPVVLCTGQGSTHIRRRNQYCSDNHGSEYLGFHSTRLLANHELLKQPIDAEKTNIAQSKLCSSAPAAPHRAAFEREELPVLLYGIDHCPYVRGFGLVN
jgi:hypothetical protein